MIPELNRHLTTMSTAVIVSAATNAAAAAGRGAGPAIIDINPGQVQPQPLVQSVQAIAPASSKKFAEPLFGPSIGNVSTGPSWTLTADKDKERDKERGREADELTQDVVSKWIEKSKEV